MFILDNILLPMNLSPCRLTVSFSKTVSGCQRPATVQIKVSESILRVTVGLLGKLASLVALLSPIPIGNFSFTGSDISKITVVLFAGATFLPTTYGMAIASL